MIVYEKRASVILLHFLTSSHDDRPYLLPSNVCEIVPLIFVKARRPFEFIDISEKTFGMDEGRVLDALRKHPGRYGGVLFVRPYGVERAFDGFFRAVKEIDDSVMVIDDCCMCAPDPEMPLSPSADLICYSTGYAKYCDAGGGGFGRVSDGTAYRRKEYPFDAKTSSEVIKECKSKAAKGERFICKSDDWLDTGVPALPYEDYIRAVKDLAAKMVSHKRQLNDIYAKGIPSDLQFPPEYQNWRFNAFMPRRDELLKEISSQGLFASAHYHSMARVYSDARAPLAERFSERVINFFNDLHFDADRARRVVEIVNAHLKRCGAR